MSLPRLLLFAALPLAGTGLHPDAAGAAESTPPAAEALLMSHTEAVPVEELAALRGGLRVDDLDITFGITRSAAVNGVEQFVNSVTIGDVGDLAGQVGALQSVLIQNGPGNSVTPGVLDSLSGNLGTLIQNTLDTQTIETKTVLDIAVGNVGHLVNGLDSTRTVGESLRQFQIQP